MKNKISDKNWLEMELKLQDIKTLGNYSEKEKEKYEFEKKQEISTIE